MADPKHGTTVASATDPLVLTLEVKARRFAVMSVDGAGLVYYTIDGSTPQVDHDGSFVLPAAVQEVPHNNPGSGAPVVKFVSAAAVKVSVRPL